MDGLECELGQHAHHRGGTRTLGVVRWVRIHGNFTALWGEVRETTTDRGEMRTCVDGSTGGEYMMMMMMMKAERNRH